MSLGFVYIGVGHELSNLCVYLIYGSNKSSPFHTIFKSLETFCLRRGRAGSLNYNKGLEPVLMSLFTYIK